MKLQMLPQNNQKLCSVTASWTGGFGSQTPGPILTSKENEKQLSRKNLVVMV